MNDKLIQQGWECPKCGRVYSPAVVTSVLVCKKVPGGGIAEFVEKMEP